MAYTPEMLELIANLAQKFMFTGTYGQTEYMGSTCIAVTSNGEYIYIAANDLISDRNAKVDTLAATEKILKSPSRPTIWKRNKYRLQLSKKQRFWNQIEMVAYMLGLVFSIHPSRFLFIPNRKGDLDRSFHAEMQLIRYHEMAEIPINPRYVAVSKPCCLKCTMRLLQLKIGFRGTHNVSENKDWVDPTEYLFPESHDFPFLGSSAVSTGPPTSSSSSSSSSTPSTVHIEDMD